MKFSKYHFQPLHPIDDTGLVSELDDLSSETLRDIAVTILVAFIIFVFVGGMTWPVELGPRIWLSIFSFIPFIGLSLWLLPHSLDLARISLLAGLVTGISINLLIFQVPEIGFLFGLLPLISVTIAGWKMGVVTEVIVGLLVFFVLRLTLSPNGLDIPIVIFIGGAFTGLLGYATRRTLLIVTERSLSSYSEARKNTLEAREHRGKLVKLLKDIDQAYYQLGRANSALVSAMKVAEEAERFKTELVTTISHELRTPLNLIIGFTEVIMTSPESYGDVGLPSAYRSDLNAIYRSALHILALVDDVIDMARLDIGHLSMTRSQTQLQGVIDEAIEMVRDYINTKGLSLTIQIEKDLPAVWIDRIRVRQVLLNILVNAIRFTKRGGITVQAERNDDMINVKVIDTGKGISSIDLPLVFDEFQTSDHPDANWHSGSGLGIPISKKIIEAHGGRMTAESVFGHGSTFLFTLPTIPEVETNKVKTKQKNTSVQGRLNHLADPLVNGIVITYQDPWVQTMFQRAMGQFQIHKADNLEEADKIANQLDVLAVITDQQLISLPKQGKRLFIQCSLPSTRRAAEALGAQDLLIKPITAQLLWEMIDHLGVRPGSALIIDDDADITRLFRRILRLNFQNDRLFEVNDGEEAIQQIREKQPDLILLDLDMPGMNGLSVLAQKNADPEISHIPVLLITGHEDRLLANISNENIVICRPEGLNIGEAVRAIEAIIKSLMPQVEWSDSNGLAPRSRHVEKRVLEDMLPPQDSSPVSAT
jgi:signal transduction histidine kinase/CheY-like chemotaxis protein